MSPSTYESLAAYILTVDKLVLGFLLPVNLLLAVAVVALVTRERKPLEVIALLLFAWVLFFSATVVLFDFILDKPFMRLEVVQFPWLYGGGDEVTGGLG